VRNGQACAHLFRKHAVSQLSCFPNIAFIACPNDFKSQRLIADLLLHAMTVCAAGEGGV
jgi:hypothetical protein